MTFSLYAELLLLIQVSFDVCSSLLTRLFVYEWVAMKDELDVMAQVWGVCLTCCCTYCYITCCCTCMTQHMYEEYVLHVAVHIAISHVAVHVAILMCSMLLHMYVTATCCTCMTQHMFQEYVLCVALSYMYSSSHAFTSSNISLLRSTRHFWFLSVSVDRCGRGGAGLYSICAHLQMDLQMDIYRWMHTYKKRLAKETYIHEKKPCMYLQIHICSVCAHLQMDLQMDICRWMYMTFFRYAELLLFIQVSFDVCGSRLARLFVYEWDGSADEHL